MARVVATLGCVCILAACGCSTQSSNAGGPQNGGGSAGSANGGSGATSSRGAAGNGGSAATSSGGAAGNGSSGGGSMPGASGACNAVAQLGSEVVSTVDEQDPAPIPAGGAIQDGTYVLTDAAYYDVLDAQGHVIGSGGPTASLRETLVITGKTMQAVTDNGAMTSTLSVSGTNLTLEQVCPTPATSTTLYTATAGEVLFIGTSQDEGSLGKSGALVLRFVRQQ